VIFYGFGPDRLERPVTHVQQDFAYFHPPALQPVEDLGRKVEPSGRGRDRPRVTGVDRLIAQPVLGRKRTGGTAYVWRKRRFAYLFEPGRQVQIAFESQQAQRAFSHVDDAGLKIAYLQLLAAGSLAPGSQKRQPMISGFSPNQKDLDLFLFPRPVRSQARRKDTGVVDDQEVSGIEDFRKLPEDAMLPGAGVPVDHHHAGFIARGKRMLRDEPLGQFEIEVG
jgi:hypothetical protein